MSSFHLYRADCIGNAKNCLYPHTVEVGDAESLTSAVSRDYVAAEYQGGYRSDTRFLSSDCLALDCDNDHSEDPTQWVTPEIIMRLLPDVTAGFHFSRHHLLVKDGKSARPRFHCFFLIDRMVDAAAYADLKKRLNALFPFFDTKALDAARFFFGTTEPAVAFFPGTITLNECLDCYYPDDPFVGMPDSRPVIPQGSRNNRMHDFAVRVLKRCGISEEAKEAYRRMAEHCEPALETEELRDIWQSSVKFYKKTISVNPDYVPPEEFGKEPSAWEEPIPFSQYSHMAFPVDALPEDLAAYVAAVAESTQTPVDMAGTAVLSILSVCLQGKYRVQGKADWLEPLNTYALIIATPSERKSSVLNLMLRPLNAYEEQYNRQNASQVESSRMRKRILEKRQKVLEDQIAKGKADEKEMERVAAEIASYEEQQPLQLYVDDVTTEKLVSVLSVNKGRAALVSSEGGIFDTLAGIYTRNVNIDVMLKGYSGDPIRVDRIGRQSECVMNPALTVLLMAQPDVVSAVLGNRTFRGRGLTARFLYCLPVSRVGSRKADSAPIPEAVSEAYERKICNLLEDEYEATPRVILLSEEARDLLFDFSRELEPKLAGEYADIADWAGKLIGNTMRLAALLCRAGVALSHEFLDEEQQLVVDGATMAGAIRLGRYFLVNALAAYDALPEKAMAAYANRVLDMIREKKLKEFDRRTAMRNCRFFKTVAEIQPVLDFMEDYGYIFQQPVLLRPAGRPPLPKYTVNPSVLEEFRHAVLGLSGEGADNESVER